MLNKEKRSEINKLHHCVCVQMCVWERDGFYAAATERTIVTLLMDVFGGKGNPKRQQWANNVCFIYIRQKWIFRVN